ncbi:MAG: transglutaminase domain-containing protein, partial [Actinobacteria bacterium]|nr:transglutaminase domain-containing protein [Actinomycetota bacterium]
LLGALLTLLAAGTVAFGRVFEANGTALRLVLAATLSLALAAALERQHVLVATIASVAGLALLIGWLVYPDTTWYGLPTLETWERVAGSLEAVGRTAEAHVAPAPTLPPLFLAALSAVWASAFAVHALAVRARSPFLALLPPSALLAFAGIVMKEGARPVYVLPFLAAALAVLFCDALYRVAQWGPLTIWRGAGRLGFGSAAWTRGARRVALASMVAALFTPWILPGFTSGSFVGVGRGGTGESVTIDPIVDIRPRLLEQPDVELFTVEADRGSYWRFVALDEFNGDRWTSSNLDAERGLEVTGELPVSAVRRELADRLLRQQFQFTAAVQSWLPAAYSPVRMGVSDEAVRLDPDTGSLVLPGGTFRGLTYWVTSLEFSPEPRILDTLGSLAVPGSERYTELPGGLPTAIRALARDWVAGQPNPYRQVLAIQDRLKSEPFRYEADAPVGSGSDDILNFLLETKAGYCEQFAGTMAVMLRTLGIPARVAVGTTQGTRDEESGVWHVTGKNAHAWVEVLFPQYGWLAFEPTPGRANPTADVYQSPTFQSPDDGSSGSVSAGNQRGEVLRGKQLQLGANEVREAGTSCFANPRLCPGGPGPGVDTRAGGDDASGIWRAIGGVAVVLAILILVGIPLGKLVRRRWMLGRARLPREVVLAAYGVLVDEARDLGLGRRPGETLREYRERLERSVAFSNGHLSALTAVAGRAAYSDLEVTSEEADDAVADARQIRDDIRRSSGWLRVALGWFRLDRFSVDRATRPAELPGSRREEPVGTAAGRFGTP